MHRLLSITLFSLLLVLQACKHKPAAQSKKDDNFRFEKISLGGVESGNGQMTAEKASEEETFVQGCIEKSLGNNRKAMQKFQECLDMNPNNAAANYELAGLYRAEGQRDRALRYAQAAVTLSPDNRWYKLRYADLLQENAKYDEATKIFRDLSAADPSSTVLLYRYAASLRLASRYDEALEVYGRIQALEGISDSLTNCRLSVYRAKNDPAGEEKTLRDLVAANPGEAANHFLLADFYTRNKQADKAEEVYRGMTAAFPHLATPHLRMAESYQVKGQRDKAFSEAARAFEISSSPDDKAAYLRRYYPVSDSADGLSAAQKKEADSLCRIMRRVHPGLAQSYLLSGNYQYAGGKLKEARDYYRKALSLSNDSYESWKRLLLINDRLKDNTAQEQDCKAALELYATQPEPYYYLGQVYLQKQEYKKAISELQSAVDFSAGNPVFESAARKLLIKACRAAGDQAKADEYSEEAMRRDSSDYELIAAYCESLAERQDKLATAEQLMRRVVEKSPGNASYLQTMAWVEYRMKKYTEAKNWMDKAIARSPEDARINERMGDILFRLGQPDEALRYWKKAKDKGGSSSALDRKISTKTMFDTE